MQPSDTTRSPDTPLLLPATGFIGIALFSIGMACATLLVHPDLLTGAPIRGPVLALTHLITLGWIGSLLFAGAYLVGPTLAGTILWSRRLPGWHLLLHVSGLALLIGGLWAGHYFVAGTGGALLCLGLVLLILNLQMTGNKKSLWTPANLAFQSALFWLAITGALALYMLHNRLHGGSVLAGETLIALHAHYALFGFLCQALLGISLYMTPRLLGSRSPTDHCRGWSWGGWSLLNFGLLLIFPGSLSQYHPIILLAGICLALGVAGFTAEIILTIWRDRHLINWGIVTHATGLILLVLVAVGALSGFWRGASDQPEKIQTWMRLYISLALLGPFAFAIFGSAERLIPMLIWKLRYEPWQHTASSLPSAESLRREAAGGPVYFALLFAWMYLAIGQILSSPEAIRLGAILFLLAGIWFFIAISPALYRFLLGVTPAELTNWHSLKPFSDSSTHMQP